MKRLIFIFLGLSLLAGKSASAQSMPFDTTKKKVIYTEVVSVPGTNKDKLQDRALTTLRSIYKEADKKIVTNDKGEGKLVLNGYTKIILKDPKTGLMTPDPAFVKYKLQIDFKDGKYRYTFYDFNIDKGGYPFPIERWVDPKFEKPKNDRVDEKVEFVNNDIRNIIAKLKEGMKQDKVQTKSDW